jgi:TonB-linked SusC/RagA family outer membrane protein
MKSTPMKSKIFKGFINLRKSRIYKVRPENPFPMLKTMLFILLLSILTSFQNLNAQNLKQISGVVKDASGESIPGVSVTVKGTQKSTITNLEGVYSIQVPENATTLVFSFIGMKKVEANISGTSKLDVTMESETMGLGEVLVVGYGTQKKETSTGAISTVKSADIVKTPLSNVGNTLVGLVPGISSVQFGGEPGSNDATIRIRGVSTLNGAGQEALVVIDGLQQGMVQLNALNPNDISSVSVLKDASATAIYGIRGANGVIIVTTKRGLTGKPNISFSTNYGFTQATNLFNPVNSAEYAIFRNEALKNDDLLTKKSNLFFTDDEIWKFQNNRDYRYASELDGKGLTNEQVNAALNSPALYYTSHDYFKEQYGGQAPQAQVNLNVSGGSDKLDYFTSVAYFKQDGVLDYNYYDNDVNSHYKRYNFRTNVDIKSIKNLVISLNLSARFSSTSGLGVTNQENVDRYWTMNQWLMEASPYQGPGIRDGKLVNAFVKSEYPIKDTKGGDGVAPINSLISSGVGSANTSNIVSTLNLKYKLDYLLKGLSAGGMLSYDDTYTKASTVTNNVPRYTVVRNPENPAEVLYYGGAVGPSVIVDNIADKNYKSRSYYGEARISYDRQFGDHAVSAVVIGNWQKNYNPNLMYHVPEGLMGMASRATYNYKEKYLAEVNMAYNGSENFPEENRFGFFPSFSAGWVISREDFFKNIEFVTWLKVRGSYGIVGNDKIGGNRFLYLPSTWANYGTNPNAAILHGYFFGTTNGSAPASYYPGSYEDRLGNPVVTWEKARKRNISLETRFLKDRLSFTVELFDEDRTDILWDLGKVPLTVGATLPKANIGEVFNKGYEVELGWRDRIGKVGYVVKGYVAYAVNKIIYKDEPPFPYDWMNETGYSIGQYKGYNNIGFFNNTEEVNNRPYTAVGGNKIQPGDLRYVDVNGDGKLDASDNVPIGFSNLPRFSYSSTVGLDYKGFDITVLFTGSAQGSFLMQGENLTTPFFVDDGIALQWQYDGRWTPEKVAAGITPTFPRAGFNNAGNNNGSPKSDFWLRANDYIKLKNIDLGYSFKNLSNRLNVKTIRLSLSANNVWLIKSSLIDGLDPEQLQFGKSDRGFIFPMTSAYMAGINIEF